MCSTNISHEITKKTKQNNKHKAIQKNDFQRRPTGHRRRFGRHGQESRDVDGPCPRHSASASARLHEQGTPPEPDRRTPDWASDEVPRSDSGFFPALWLLPQIKKVRHWKTKGSKVARGIPWATEARIHDNTGLKQNEPEPVSSKLVLSETLSEAF